MSDFAHQDPRAPLCPVCTEEMALKNIFRQKPHDHFIFQCGRCELEYPLVATGPSRVDRSSI